MKNGPLKQLTIAITGFFGSDRPTYKLKDWIQHQGGNYSSEITSKVTHLVCSKDHYKQNAAMVQQAKKLWNIKIVSYDWLEDCCIQQKRLDERKYLLRSRIKTAMEMKVLKKAVRDNNIKRGMEDFERGCQDFEKDMFASGYHIYHDLTTFAYDVTLARINLLENKNERWNLKVCKSPFSTPLYPIVPISPRPRTFVVSTRAQRLQLYESHATPKLYACYTKYSAPSMVGKAEVIAPIGSSFESAFENFKKFFQLKTRKDWSERITNTVNMGSEAFTYAVPK